MPSVSHGQIGRRQLLLGIVGSTAGAFLSTTLAGTAGAKTAHTPVLPNPPSSGIPLAQIFESAGMDRSVYQDRVYFVWSSHQPDPWPGVVGSVYVPGFRDPDRTHDLAWYQQNHPTWVLYQADRVTPAYIYTYPNGNPMPLDVSNPDVREFFFSTYVQPWIDRGYPIIGVDNISLFNTQRAGRFDADGNWVQMFSGAVTDPAHITWVVDWIQYVADRLHAQGVGIAGNIGAPPSRLSDTVAMQGIRETIAIVDLWLDEIGFTAARPTNITDAQWQAKFQLVRDVAATTRYVSINQMTTPLLADADQDQVDWAVANFLLSREQPSMFTLCGLQEYRVFLDRPEIRVDVGAPTGPPTQVASGAWKRCYDNGFVIVNPSSTAAASVTLPPGIWHTVHGLDHVGTTNVGATRGLVLLPGPANASSGGRNPR